MFNPPSSNMLPNTALMALMLGCLALLGPLSVDAYLPAFSSIQSNFKVDMGQVQLTLTTYLFAYAVMSLWHGVLSDATGRRKMILISLAIFSFASVGCAISQDVGMLSGFRILQGISAGAGTVVGQAIIRDVYQGAAAARMLSLVSMIFAFSPAFAPILGGWVISYFHWRAIFVLLAVFTILLLCFCWRFLPETLPTNERQSLNPRDLVRNYKSALLSKGFQRGVGAIAFNFAGLFLFVAAAPVIIGEHLGLSEKEFSWQFVPMVGGLFLGALAANRLAAKIKFQHQIFAGFVMLLSAALANVLVHFSMQPSLPWSVMPIFFYAFGMSIAAPNLTLSVLDLFPSNRGLAASLQAFVVVMLAAIVTAIVAPALQSSMLNLSLGQLALGTVGFTFWLSGRSKYST